MDELRLRIDYELGTEVGTVYLDRPVTLHEAKLEIEALDGVPAKVRLIARLNAEVLAQLPELLAGQPAPVGSPVVEFAMTPAALQAISPELAQAGTLEEWLQAGNGACLKLDNYAIERVVTGVGHEPVELEFELD